MYRITHYQEGYIDKQIEIGTEVISTWKYQSQSNKKLMKELYSSDDFDPETRLYAFEGNTMVGFLPAKIVEEDDRKIALYEFPIVLEEHEEEVTPLLIEKSFEVLKDKGVEQIRARVSPHWGNTEKYADTYGFTPLFDTLVTAEIDPDQFNHDQFQDYNHIVDMDYENQDHLDAFAESFSQRYPMRYEGEIEEWIKYYKDLNRAGQLLYLEGDKVMGHVIAVLREGQEQKPVITAFYSQGESQGKKMRELLEALLNRILQNNYQKIHLALGTEQVEYLDDLKQLGIQFETQVSRYSKDLEKYHN